MDDLISRQAAIYAIEKRMDDITCEEFAEGMSEAITEISLLPSAQQWIPCSERLPDENGRYLTTNSSWGYFEVDWNVWINGEWLYPNENPVAWMPMPEPWKGEENG